MGMSRQVGGLTKALAPSVAVLRGRAATARPWVCRDCSAASPVSVARFSTSRRAWFYLPSTNTSYPTLDDFARRHIGPDEKSTNEMLEALQPPVRDMDDFVRQVIPEDILSDRPLFTEGKSGVIPDAYTESQIREAFDQYKALNKSTRSFIGAGYYGTLVPEVIKRNVLESPAWYTSYTPYQAEISQGRLESLLNFQTLVSDLTALPVSNASLLDEGTAAAEAMTLSINALPSSRAKKGRVYVVSNSVHPATINVLRSRADGFGIELRVAEVNNTFLPNIRAFGDRLVGVMVQYPDTFGQVHDFRTLTNEVHKQGGFVSVATDLLALTMLTPPGEWGADIAFGSAQRFGVPLGFGGPHAAFFAVKDKLKRKMPGRLVGVSKDRLGNRALRLALQTREQHIRREKATSNVCTAQALLANMSALYAIYHGPEGLKAIAERVNRGARVIQAAAKHHGFETVTSGSDLVPFDTVFLKVDTEMEQKLTKHAKGLGLSLRILPGHGVGISIDEATRERDLVDIVTIFARTLDDSQGPTQDRVKMQETSAQAAQLVSSLLQELPASAFGQTGGLATNLFQRTSSYLTHPVFNTHHSETELLRYIHHLQSKDLSLVHSMIPLGSCTMKLNASSEMALITDPAFANIHPHVTNRYSQGYAAIIAALSAQLRSITAMDGVSLQPNSGAQGEFAGLRAIRQFHRKNGDKDRNICLIPVSAHGTNPASAAMAGMDVAPIKCDTKTGNLDIEDLKAKCEQHAGKIAAIMITYPSTFGVFEPQIKEACRIVHEHGGQVYMDGANLNAQIGLCSPGEIGADVCHLNLHKTFCIPHGGGGPGVGPICVKSHLIDHLPGILTRFSIDPEKSNPPVSSADYGSAGILPISWAYNAMMGADGLKQATKITLLNANYLLSRLKPHYPILYTNAHERCAHEFILDARPFRETAGVEAIDIAKRLQDYGFHAPTMSWPVANTLMIEPTESESKEELDRFVDALVSIRQEIRDVEEGRAPRKGNVLKMAPHSMADIIDGDGDGGATWTRPYSREKAAYPLPWLREKKFWPSVSRVDDTYGDLNLFCTCPPVEDTTGGSISSIQEN